MWIGQWASVELDVLLPVEDVWPITDSAVVSGTQRILSAPGEYLVAVGFGDMPSGLQTS